MTVFSCSFLLFLINGMAITVSSLQLRFILDGIATQARHAEHAGVLNPYRFTVDHFDSPYRAPSGAYPTADASLICIESGGFPSLSLLHAKQLIPL